MSLFALSGACALLVCASASGRTLDALGIGKTAACLFLAAAALAGYFDVDAALFFVTVEVCDLFLLVLTGAFLWTRCAPGWDRYRAALAAFIATLAAYWFYRAAPEEAACVFQDYRFACGAAIGCVCFVVCDNRGAALFASALSALLIPAAVFAADLGIYGTRSTLYASRPVELFVAAALASSCLYYLSENIDGRATRREDAVSGGAATDARLR